MGYDRVFRVTATALNLREGPSVGHKSLVPLLTGQAVLRLDTADHEGWWYVFADTPGEGLYIGYVHSDYLRPVQQDGVAGESEAEDVPRELAPETPEAGRGDGAGAEAPAWLDGWNPAVPQSARHAGNFRKTNDARPVRRVIIHVTGGDTFEGARKTFTLPGGVTGAHYVIEADGTLHQFVSEERRANHAGMHAHVRKLYLKGGRGWRRYKKYFTKANLPGRNFPPGSVYLDEALNVLPGETSPGVALVMPPGGGEWPDYAYFDSRWGPGALPPGLSSASPSPNADSIGIEIVSVGGGMPDPKRYSDAMYATLGPLVADICARHGLAVMPETVCGHEDVNPVERWGWDPGQGFDWGRLFSLAGAAPQPAV